MSTVIVVVDDIVEVIIESGVAVAVMVMTLEIVDIGIATWKQLHPESSTESM